MREDLLALYRKRAALEAQIFKVRQRIRRAEEEACTCGFNGLGKHADTCPVALAEEEVLR